MKLRIVSSSHKLPEWAQAACADYLRRLPRELLPETVELKPAPRDQGRTPAQILDIEAERIAAATRGYQVAALDQRGQSWTSAHFAKTLADWRDRGLATAFVIGSADGLAESVKRNANVILSLSALTLPHGLVRVVLAEQIYRAATLIQGHPYHRE